MDFMPTANDCRLYIVPMHMHRHACALNIHNLPIKMLPRCIPGYDAFVSAPPDVPAPPFNSKLSPIYKPTNKHLISTRHLRVMPALSSHSAHFLNNIRLIRELCYMLQMPK